MAVDHAKRVLGDKVDEKLLILFFVLYKTARIMDAGNATYKNQSESFFNHLALLTAEHGDVTIKSIGGHYFINERMVKFDDHGSSGAAQVVAEWKTLGVGGITFEASASINELIEYRRTGGPSQSAGACRSEAALVQARGW
jgi:hypothetical protein